MIGVSHQDLVVKRSVGLRTALASLMARKGSQEVCLRWGILAPSQTLPVAAPLLVYHAAHLWTSVNLHLS